MSDHIQAMRDKEISNHLAKCEAIGDLSRDLSEAQDHIKELEEIIENLWKETKGIIPSNGKMWLTPRMAREAELLKGGE